MSRFASSKSRSLADRWASGVVGHSKDSKLSCHDDDEDEPPDEWTRSDSWEFPVAAGALSRSSSSSSDVSKAEKSSAALLLQDPKGVIRRAVVGITEKAVILPAAAVSSSSHKSAVVGVATTVGVILDNGYRMDMGWSCCGRKQQWNHKRVCC
mmetsp:Transcript_14569/g.40375  ORF Transcript_14569/g.40375 Transcript_14569/m.40375 type:complete len:153 (+) Transcript_14569:1286-1744(+)